MGTIEKVCALAVEIANDDNHGYSQKNRWGNPDFDCSSLVIWLWEKCGVPVKQHGATYTGNMINAFLECGFRVVNPVIEALEAGDVLINIIHHAALYIGNGQIVQATIAENGTIDGQPGDQTKTEIGIFKYYDYPWDRVLRFEKDDIKPLPTDEISYSDEDCVSTQIPILQRGEWGPAVAAVQGALKYHGFFAQNDISGIFDVKTESAILDFQRIHKLEVDGICGPITWNELCFWR